MDFIDYYKILGIPKTATEADIKKAYRKLARKYHPDVNPNDASAEKKFKEINEANEVLSHPENRKKYDKYGKDWKHAEAYEEQAKQQQSWQQQAGSSQFQGSGGFQDDDFSDFFNSMFGQSSAGYQGRRQGRSVKYKGQDFVADLHLDLKDAYTTHKQTLTVNGKKIRITIPAGVQNGQTIKIKGYGGEGVNGGPSGDLNIKFSISNHSKFKRDKANLYTNVDLDLYTAVLGGEVVINTFDGKVKLKVKAGTATGSQVKLKGKGFPVYKKEGMYGDLYVQFNVTIPTELSKREKELFTELSKLR